MTSKEALSKLWVGCVGKAMIEEHNAVLKDLELLEKYRNLVTEYASLKGRNIKVSVEEIVKDFKELENEWEINKEN